VWNRALLDELSQAMRDASICGLGQRRQSADISDQILSRRVQGSGRMTKITFELDGKQVEAKPGETIWQVAKRRAATSRISAIRRRRLSPRRQLPRLHGRDRGRARAAGLLQAHADRRHEGEDGKRARRSPRRRW
jgi:hypothetical protein